MNEPNTETQPTQPLPSGSQRPKRLLRARKDRMVWGVAGGLARYFRIDPVIVRIAFGVSIFFGGLGLLVYAALTVFVPTGDGDGDAVDPPLFERKRWLGVAAGVAIALLIPTIGGGILWDGGHWGFWGFLYVALVAAFGFGLYQLAKGVGKDGKPRTSGAKIAATALMVALAVIVFPVLAILAAYVTAIGDGVFAAIAVAVLALVLVATAFAGGARWLIVPAVALATGVGVAAAANLDWPTSVGEREYRPATASSIPAGGYQIGVGRLLVDLRDMQWSPNQVVSLEVDAGVGSVDVVVPTDVCVAADAHAGAGQLVITGERNDGLDVDGDRYLGAPGSPRLELTANIDVGELRVINDDNASIGDRFHGPFDGGSGDGDLAAQRDAAAEACVPPDPSPQPGNTHRPGQPDHGGGGHSA